MGKKRITSEKGGEATESVVKSSTASKRKVSHAVLHIQATYNNTKLLLTDPMGNALTWSSSGSLGFKGAKKGTPFAAGKVAEVIANQAETMGVKEVDVIVKGVGAGREAAIRAFMARGFIIDTIKDSTPVPFNGPKLRKPRRV